MKVNCYLATKAEVEGFRDQCFVLLEVCLCVQNQEISINSFGVNYTLVILIPV